MTNNFGSIIIISTHSLTRRLTRHRDFQSVCAFISTHSLTRRLTQSSTKSGGRIAISTHSLTRRLTTVHYLCLFVLLFQLTASQGG